MKLIIEIPKTEEEIQKDLEKQIKEFRKGAPITFPWEVRADETDN